MLVGGRPADIAALAEQVAARGVAAHVHFVGQVTQEHAARYLVAADVLVIPDTVTSSSASPLKLFEYMAAGRPIVLPDLAALREIATDDDAWYFRRGSRADLARALARALDDLPASTARAARALVRVQRYTYAGRASQICATAHHAVRGDSMPPQEGAA
jgi:glycosyltransferase involved in cell wall biosynthesis